MISLKTAKCLNCGKEYETKFIKLRIQLFSYTYEKCPHCGKWGLNKIVYKTNADDSRQDNIR
jgi:DNA-directed RNA polymerase subunit RPC12/RpoP